MPDTTAIARKLAALERLGLRRAAPEPFDESAEVAAGTWRVRSSRPGLGSVVDITAVASSEGRAVDAVALAFGEMERLRRIFDRHDGSSALSVLNAEGVLPDAPPELTSLIGTSRRYSVASAAAFDITVAPLVDLFRDAAREPHEAEIAERRALVGHGGIGIGKRRVTFARSGMKVTMDAIAKGAIVDAMARVLERRGVVRWLVNAGGDIRASGLSERDTPWTVAVRDPSAMAALPGSVEVTAGAVATSGGNAPAAAGEADGPREIVNGANGWFPRECLSATVVAPSATAADALATAVVALGPRAGLALVERLRCACLIVLPDGRLVRSGNWKETSA